jgi:hypothetical protein
MSPFFSRATCLFFASLLISPTALSQSVSFTITETSYSSQTHADFNSDGREDFVVGEPNGCSPSQFALVLSTGDGTYDPPTCYTVPVGTPKYFAIGDFNGDGNPDVIVSIWRNAFYEYLGERSGKLHLANTFVIGGAPINTANTAQSLGIADVNHDGNMDFVYGCPDCSEDLSFHTFLGDGHGGFRNGPQSLVRIPAGVQLVGGDFNGDGKVDLLSQSQAYFSFSTVSYGDGAGNFTLGPIYNGPIVYAPYDLNGDGRTDLVGDTYLFQPTGTTYYKRIKVLYGNADHTFTVRFIGLGNCTIGPDPPAVADFNGDGINDIAVVEGSDCKGHGPVTLNILLGKDDGTYAPELPLFTGTVTERFGAPLVLRSNRDSKPDLALFELSAAANGRVLFFQNDSTGDFPSCSPPDQFSGFALCSPNSNVASSSTVRFSIGAANQTPGRKVEVWIDGNKMGEQLKQAFSYYSFLDASYSLSNGKHKVTIFSAGWDNHLESVTFPLTVGSTTCLPPSSPGLNICSPLNDSSITGTVLAWAGGTVTGTIQRMEVWVDGVKKFSSFGSPTLKTNLAVASGPHTIGYYIVNTAGTKWLKVVNVNVR